MIIERYGFGIKEVFLREGDEWMLCIWDKKENKTVPIDDYDLYIGADGKVYELEVNAGFGGDVWLSREDASSRYEVRYRLDQLIK